MKLDRIIWGIIFLFVGAILLLENFGVIDFYWRSVWQFWPIGVILIGLNIIFGGTNSKIGNTIMIAVVLIGLGGLFIVGQKPRKINFSTGISRSESFDSVEDQMEEIEQMEKSYSIPFKTLDSSRIVTLNLNADGSELKLKKSTDQLFTAFIDGDFRNTSFFLKEEYDADSANTINFRAERKSKRNFINGNSPEINVSLHENPVWDLNINAGAGDIDFDFRTFKINKLKLNGGAVNLNLKVGNKLPITHIELKTGVSNLELEIPESSGCQIITKTALSNKEFPGFTKKSRGVYETSNFSSAANKIYIKMNGGLSNFEVNRN